MNTRLTRSRRIRLIQLLVVAGVILLLEYLAQTEVIGRITLAPPSEMVTVLVELLASGEIFNDIIITSLTVFAAFSLATVIGVPIGWVLWNWNVLQRILDPYLVSFYAMPIFALYPLFVSIFGLNRFPIILIAFLMSIISIVINTANGFGNVRDVYRDVGRSLQLSRYEAFRHIFFPAATPYIFTGLKLGFVYALIGVIASEFILANAGLGFQVSYDYANFAVSEMYAEMLLVTVIAILTGIVLNYIEDRLYERSVSA